MSEIRANTISDAAGTGPATLTKQSAAKAWANWNGTGTVAIRDSFNVSSLTDRAAGAQSANLTSAFAAADYSFTAGTRIVDVVTISQANYQLSSASALEVISYNNSFVNTDALYMAFDAHGDLA